MFHAFVLNIFSGLRIFLLDIRKKFLAQRRSYSAGVVTSLMVPLKNKEMCLHLQKKDQREPPPSLVFYKSRSLCYILSINVTRFIYIKLNWYTYLLLINCRQILWAGFMWNRKLCIENYKITLFIFNQ